MTFSFLKLMDDLPYQLFNKKGFRVFLKFSYLIVNLPQKLHPVKQFLGGIT